MFEKLGIFQMAKAQMDWIAQRQEVLAENVANANTPKYLPKDLKPLDFKSVLAGTMTDTVQVAATDPRHIVPEMGVDVQKALVQKKTYESTPSGNAVVLEEQMAKVGEAAGAYNAAAAIYSKYRTMIRTALGSR
jgi:flagellar basal-body rod protein FlgB